MEKNHWITFISISLFLLLNHSFFGQKDHSYTLGDTTGKYHFSIGLLGGSIVPHRAAMQNVITGHSAGVSIQYLHRPPHQFWRMYQNNPIDGWDLYFSTTGNPNQLGYQTAISYILYRRVPLFHSSRLWWGTGLGLGYTNLTWDLYQNHQAPILSTHLNAAMIIHLQYECWRFKKSNLCVGMRITHLSNGAYQLPNLGTNNIQLTLTHQPRMTLPKGRYSYICILPSFMSSRILSIQGAMGIKETYQPLGKKYPVWNAQVTYAHRINDRHRWIIGLDYLNQPALKKLWWEYKGVQATPIQSMQLGLNLGFQTIFGNTWFSIHQGCYIFSPWKENGALYHRLSLRRNFKMSSYGASRTYLYAALFTHFAKADHFEFGLGWDITKR